MKYFSLRERQDPIPTKSTFKSIVKILTLLILADHKFLSPPLRNPKVAFLSATSQPSSLALNLNNVLHLHNPSITGAPIHLNTNTLQKGN